MAETPVVQADPSSQASGIIKWGVTLAAGVIASRLKLDPVTVGGAMMAVGTLIWQIMHRKKVGRAIDAAVALPPTASSTVVADTVRAA